MKKLLVFLGIVISCSVLGAGVTHAATFRAEDQPHVKESDVIDGSLFITGKDVVIDGTVKGDVYCAAESVRVHGIVEGDVLCAAGKFELNGEIQGDARIAAQFVGLAGVVSGGVTAVAQHVAVEKTGQIARDITAMTKLFKAEGEIGRDAIITTESATFAGPLGRDVHLTTESTTIQPTAAIGGKFTYISASAANIQNESVVAGGIDRQAPLQGNVAATPSPISFGVYGFVSMFIAGLVVLAVKPRLLPATTNKITTQPLTTFGAGLLGLIAVPVVALLLLVTVIGAPLALLLWLLWLAALILAIVFGSHALGVLILRRLSVDILGRRGQIMALASGLAVVMLIGLIPFLGALVMLPLIVWGMGSLSYTIHDDTLTQKEVV